MLPSAPTKHKHDVPISRLTNSIYYYIDTCFIMDLSGTVQGKNRYRLLAFHEGEKKVFIDKNYSSLTGAKIAFGKKFKNIAWSDKVTPIWTFFYKPEKDWLYEMLDIVENLKFSYHFKGQKERR